MRKKSAPIIKDNSVASVNVSMLSKRSASNSHISASRSRQPTRTRSPMAMARVDQGFSKHADETVAKIKSDQRNSRLSMNKSRGHSANPSANRS